MNKYKLFFLSSSLTFPIVILTSCSHKENKDLNLDDKINFLIMNHNKIIIPKNETIKSFPSKLFFSKESPVNIKDSFKVNDSPEFKDSLGDLDIDFFYSDFLPDGEKSIAFNFKINGEIIKINEEEKLNCSIEGFESESHYLTKLHESLINLSLKDKSKTLKEFLKSDLPNENELDKWNDLLDFIPPPGIQIKFEDIKTGEYDFKNNKLKIGIFSSNIYDLELISFLELDIKLSIMNNFIHPTKPIYIFMVDKTGVQKLPINSSINSEVIFINRQKNSKELRFNESWNRKSIYGELDFSEFNSLTLLGQNFALSDGYFANNFITSIKFPKNMKLEKGMFLNNQISEIEFPKTINFIGSIIGVFDAIEFKGLKNLNLENYYILETNTLDLTLIPSLNNLYEILFLVTRQAIQIELKAIILPPNLLTTSNDDSIIEKINKFDITVTNVSFSHVDTNQGRGYELNHKLWLKTKWKIRQIEIPDNILSIQIENINSSIIINRELHKKIKNIVIDGVLDLREPADLGIMPNYKNNLNPYLQINHENGIIKDLFLENSDDPTSSGFENIFHQHQKNTIYISQNTYTYNELEKYNFPDTKFRIVRTLPLNLKDIFKNNHLDLRNKEDIFIENFYRNLIYLEETKTIKKITFSPNVKIPHSAFKNIFLKNVEINWNNIKEIGNYSFQNTGLTGEIKSSTIIQIGNESFNNNLLTSASFPQVVSIGSSSFQKNKLKSIDFPKLSYIKSHSFQNNLLTSVSFPQVVSVGSSSFQDNELTSIDFPKIKSISSYSFQDNELTSIDLPITTIISNNSFDISIKNINLVPFPGLLMTENKVNKIDFRVVKINTQDNFEKALNQLKWEINEKKTKENKGMVEIDELYLSSFDSFGNNKFNSNIDIKINKLIIDKKVKIIPTHFFKGIKIIEIIGIEEVEEINDYAFFGCKIEKFNSYENVEKNILSTSKLILTVHELGRNAFSDNKFRELIFMPGTNLTEINQSTFSNNNQLISIDINSNIVDISQNAFDDSVWQYVKRAEFLSVDNDKYFSYQNEEIIFKSNPHNSNSLYWNKNLLNKLNGLKISKISFDNRITIIEEEFLRHLRSSSKEIEIDLTGISIILDLAFSNIETIVCQIKIINKSDVPNLIHNAENSGIKLN